MNIQKKTVIRWNEHDYTLGELAEAGTVLSDRINSIPMKEKLIAVVCHDPIHLLIAWIGVEMSAHQICFLNVTDKVTYQKYKMKQHGIELVISDDTTIFDDDVEVILLDHTKKAEEHYGEISLHSVALSDVKSKSFIQWKNFNTDILKINMDQFCVLYSDSDDVNPYVIYSILSAKKRVTIYEYNKKKADELFQKVLKNGEQELFMPLHVMQYFEHAMIINRDLSMKGVTFLTYGFSNYDFIGLKEVLKRKGAHWFNYFGMPPFQMISSLTTFQDNSVWHLCKAIKGTNVTVRNDRGAVMPDGVPGILHYMDGNGKEIKTCFMGKTAEDGKLLHTGFTNGYYAWNNRLWPFDYLCEGGRQYFRAKAFLQMNGEKGEVTVSLITEQIPTLMELEAFIEKWVPTNHPLIDLSFKTSRNEGLQKPLSYRQLKKLKEVLDKNGHEIMTMSSRFHNDEMYLNIYITTAELKNDSKVICLKISSLMELTLHDMDTSCDRVTIYEINDENEPESNTNKIYENTIKNQEFIQLEQEVMEIWQEVLQCEIKSAHSNFFEIGGNSILFVQLTSKLKDKFGVVIPIMKLIQNATVHEYCKFLTFENKVTDDETSLKEQILKDTDVKKYIPNLAEASLLPRDNVCLLTGASGFLGIHILNTLLKKTNFTVICIVRAESDEGAREKILTTMNDHKLVPHDEQRILALKGDIGEKSFGMAEETYMKLCAKVDVVINNAALPNFAFTYEMLKEVNVAGTGNMLDFSSTVKKKRFYHVSSMAVFDVESNGTIIRENYELDIDELPNRGYNQSKWAADQMVTKARTYGMDTTVLRLGNMCGDKENGITQSKDFIWMLLKMGIEMKAFPEYFNQPFNIDTVDSVAGAIVDLVLNKKNGSFHLFSKEAVRYVDLLNWIEDYGFNFEVLNFRDWANQVTKYTHQLSDRRFESVASIISSEIDVEIDDSIQFIEQDNSYTLSVLDSLKSKLCPVDASVFHRCLQHFIDIKYIQDNRGGDERGA